MREAEEGDDEVGGSGMTEGSREGEGVAEQPYDENWTVLIYCRRGAMRDGPLFRSLEDIAFLGLNISRKAHCLISFN